MNAPRDRIAVYDSLRLSERDQQALLDRLNRRGMGNSDRDGRVSDRLHYTARGVVVRLELNGSTPISYLVRPRNLSREGMGFLHGSYCHPGSRCMIVMRTINGKPLQFPAGIVRCSHVESTVHEVGVKFDDPIELHNFVETGKAEPEHTAETSQPLPTLTGRVLFVDDSRDEQALFQFIAGSIGLSTECAGDGPTALKHMAKGSFDLVLTDDTMPEMNGEQLFIALREAEYSGPIIAVTADENPELHAHLVHGGFEAVLTKPYTGQQLAELLSRYLARLGAGPDLEPIYSSMWDNRPMRPVILGFLERLEQRVLELKRLRREKQQDELIMAVMELKGASGGFGYPQISDAANDLVKVAGDADESVIFAKLDELADMCAAACLIRHEFDAAD